MKKVSTKGKALFYSIALPILILHTVATTHTLSDSHEDFKDFIAPYTSYIEMEVDDWELFNSGSETPRIWVFDFYLDDGRTMRWTWPYHLEMSLWTKFKHYRFFPFFEFFEQEEYAEGLREVVMSTLPTPSEKIKKIVFSSAVYKIPDPKVRYFPVADRHLQKRHIEITKKWPSENQP